MGGGEGWGGPPLRRTPCTGRFFTIALQICAPELKAADKVVFVVVVLFGEQLVKYHTPTYQPTGDPD